MTDSRLSFLLQLVIDDDPLLLTSPNSFSIKLNRLPLEDFILSFKSSTSYSSSPSSSESSFLFLSLWLPWPSMLWITATLSGFNRKKDKRSLYRGELEREGWRKGCARCKLRRKGLYNANYFFKGITREIWWVIRRWKMEVLEILKLSFWSGLLLMMIGLLDKDWVFYGRWWWRVSFAFFWESWIFVLEITLFIG